MTLNDKTKIGLTFGQLIAIICMIGTFAAYIMDINVQLSNLRLEITQVKLQRDEDLKATFSFRSENREDHLIFGSKLDAILMTVKRKD